MLKFPRRHPWWTIVIFTVVLIVGFGLYQFIDWTDGKPNLTPSREVTYLLGPIDDEGYIQYDVALNKIMSEGITPETNANVMLWQALGPHPEGGTGMPPEYWQALGIPEPFANGDYIIRLNIWLKTNTDPNADVQSTGNNPLYDEADDCAYEPWKTAEYPKIAQWLQANEIPLNIVVEAVKRPDYFNPIIIPPGGIMIDARLPNVQVCRDVAQLLLIRAMAQLEQCNVDAAWENILACHRLARHVDRGATLIESLVGIALDINASKAAIRFAQSEQVSTEKLQSCLGDLQRLRPLRPTHKTIGLGERIMALSLAQSIHQGLPIIGSAITLPWSRRPNLDLGLMLRLVNEFVDQAVEQTRIDLAAGKPIDLNAVIVACDAIVPDLSFSNTPNPLLMSRRTRSEHYARLLFALLIPVEAKVVSSFIRAEQSARLEQLAFALAIHFRETGQYPKQLTELKPKIMESIPIDLVPAKRLHYERTAAGYTLYSVGENGIDDNGQSFNDIPPGDDLVVRVPIPEVEEIPLEDEFSNEDP